MNSTKNAMDIRLIEAALDRQSAAIRRMAQRQPHVQYNHGSLWDMVEAAKKELRATQETSSKNDHTVRIGFDHKEFAHGHYEALPRQVCEQLRSLGVPVIGDWMVRGVEYGSLTVTFYKPEGVTFIWDSMGEEPEVDPVEELI